MILLLAAAMLNVPPLPPPPADRQDAAATLLRAAPVPSALDDWFRGRAISSTAYTFVGNAAKDEALRTVVRAFSERSASPLPIVPSKVEVQKPNLRQGVSTALDTNGSGLWVRQVGNRSKARVSSHLAASTQSAADLNGCIRDAFAYGYDVPTLRSMGEIVATTGGRALWNAALADPIERCYRTKLPEFLQYTGFASALQWFVRAGPKPPLPSYDPSAAPAVLSAALTTFCGSSTRGALVEMRGRLGVRESWERVQRNRGTLTCLVSGARLAGHDLPILADDGRPTTVILVG